MNLNEFKLLANDFGKKRKPFLFLLDFELKKPVIISLDELVKEKVYYDIHGIAEYPRHQTKNKPINLKAYPIPKEDYAKAFSVLQDNLNAGNTYLINLTFATPLDLGLNLNIALDEIFLRSKAPYKLLFKNEFTLFSPECFVRTRNGYIYSYPMKGTIDASIPNAANTILADKKETWEHNTIVDLIRNDLAMVSKNIKVTKYRFISEVHSRQKDLLQVSSEIRGELDSNWNQNIGDLLCKLLPAGSISGAPKQKTVEIIVEAEIGG